MISENPQSDDLRDSERARSPPSQLEKGLIGAKGGLVATVVMTAFRLPISGSLPPTDKFWRKYVRRDDSQSATIPAILLHLLYGMGAGVVYVMVSPQNDFESEAGAELRSVVTAVVYSLFLSAFGSTVVLNGLLDEELDADEKLIFHLGHVVYGIALGAWLGSRTAD